MKWMIVALLLCGAAFAAEDPPMDLPLVLARLCPGADWGPCSHTGAKYENLKAKWRDTKVVCPTKEELQAKWAEIVVEQAAARAKAQADKDARSTDRAKLQEFADTKDGESTAAQREAVLKILVRRLLEREK